ncbi:MAG: hypothetical protein HOI95_14255 [Chromatiales bacterium]|nr:hypothetical protein [Chromatiales bacterium]
MRAPLKAATDGLIAGDISTNRALAQYRDGFAITTSSTASTPGIGRREAPSSAITLWHSDDIASRTTAATLLLNLISGRQH